MGPAALPPVGFSACRNQIPPGGPIPLERFEPVAAGASEVERSAAKPNLRLVHSWFTSGSLGGFGEA